MSILFALVELDQIECRVLTQSNRFHIHHKLQEHWLNACVIRGKMCMDNTFNIMNDARHSDNG